MNKLKELFSSIHIGTMELKNRICLGEIGGEADADGFYTDEYIDFMVERAKGGAGLIMSGGGCPDISGVASQYIARLDDDKYIPRIREMARRIHDASPGVKVGVQIFHVGRQMHVFERGAMPGITPVAPSAIKYFFGVVPHELTTQEVEFHVNQYGEAARRLKEAGFDCAGLHGAHGYFISQFISPYTNKRTDKYGGSIENRARFACEIIQSIKKKCGKDFPVIIKINGDDFVTSEPQIHIDHTIEVAKLLEKAGADEVHISGGQHESIVPSAVGGYMLPRGVYVEFAEAVKKAVSIPVGAIHRINDPVLAENILEKKKADLIWMCRPLIADPELPNKAFEGRTDEIRTCIACNTCIGKVWEEWIATSHCAINPEAFRERRFEILPTLSPKKVLVIGGGPGGLEAARVAALIGHKVTLWEQDKKLGGQLNLAMIAPHKKRELPELMRYYEVQLKKLGVVVELEKQATTSPVAQFEPDVIIIASGAKPLAPPIPGADKKIVVDALNVLKGKTKVGNKVVVIGGGEIAMETAHFLVEKDKEKKKKITMVVRSKMGKGMVRTIYFWARTELEKAGVEMLTRAKTEEITESGVVIVDKGGHKRTIEADTVIMAAGMKSDTVLHDTLQDMAPEIYLVGDCLFPSNIESAIYQGAVVGRMLDAHLRLRN